MAFEIKEGSFSLWPNKFKVVGDAKPDFTGSGKLENGEEVDLAVWKKVAKNGTEYFGGQIKPPYKKEKVGTFGGGDDEDLPF